MYMHTLPNVYMYLLFLISHILLTRTLSLCPLISYTLAGEVNNTDYLLTRQLSVGGTYEVASEHLMAKK